MLSVSDEIKRKLEKINESIRKLYPISVLDPVAIRKRLSMFGKFYKIEKWKDEKIKDWLSGKTLVGVDGSVNSTKGLQTRTLSVFQALAKGTKGEEKWATDVYTPLLEEEGQDQARQAQHRGKLLSRLELEVTQFAIEKWQPKAVMLDGSLFHFYIDHIEDWQKAAKVAEEKGVYLVGVTEEIGSQGLVKEVYPELKGWSDRDLLYGVLEVGEAFEWEDWSPVGSQMWKMALRSSRSPLPIGLDGLEAQKEMRFDLVSLVYTLTPEQGRGIPFWLDIVDNQVRVTDPLVETLVEQYIDPDLRHRIFMPKRNERII